MTFQAPLLKSNLKTLMTNSKRGYRVFVRLFLFFILFSLFISKPVFAFPDVEVRGPSDTNPPFNFGFSGEVIRALLKDDETMIVAYGETLTIVDLGYYALTADQPPALNEDDETDGNLMALAYSSDRNRVYTPQDDGDCLIFDLSKITEKPVSAEIAADSKLGPIAIDNNSQRAYIADNTQGYIHIFDLSNLTLSSSIVLNIPSVGSFTITDAEHVKLTNEIYFTTDKGAVFYMAANGTSATEITVDSTHTDELSALAVTPTGSYIYVTNKSDDSLAKISTSSHSVVTSAIDISPNQSPTDIAIAEVTNPRGGTGNAYYAYVAGSKGITIMNTGSDLILDMGTDPAVNYEPLPMTTTPRHMLASTVTDGYIYSINTSQNVDIVSANPWVTVSSVTYSSGGSSLGIGESVTIAFQADKTGTAVVKSGGNVAGSGTALTDNTGATSWNIDAPDTDISVTFNYDDNSSAFAEGDNEIFVFATDSSGNTGRIATTVNVDTPPPNVTLRSTGFGNSRIYVTFDRLTPNDMDHYNVYVSTNPSQVLTKTDVDGQIAQSSSGDTITGSVSGLTNTFVYYIAVEGVDAGGNISPSRSNTLSDGTVAYAIPQETAGPCGFSGEGGQCRLSKGITSGPADTLFKFFILIFPIFIFIALRSGRKIRIPLLFVIFFLLVNLIPSEASAYSKKASPQWGCLEVKTGFWMPSSDPVNHFFGDCCNLITRIQGGLLLQKRYGFELGVGIFVKDGTAVGTLTGENSQDSFNFSMFPLETNFAWRLHYWSWDYVVPYFKVGFDYVFYRENVAGDVTKGIKFGFHGGGGIQISMKIFESDLVEGLDQDFGVNNISLTLEAMYQKIDNFGGSGLDLSGPVYSIGLLFEF